MAARSIEMRGARLALARRRRKPRHQCDKQMGSSAWDHTGPGDAQQAGHCRCGDIAPGRGLKPQGPGVHGVPWCQWPLPVNSAGGVLHL